MAKVGEVFPSKFIKADDMKGQTVTLTIKEVKIEEAFGSQKPVLYFQETDKALTVNPTNARIITSLLEDDETDHWAGARITLTPTMRNIAGQIKKVIDVTACWYERGVPVNQGTTAQQPFATPTQQPAFGGVPQGGAPVDPNAIPF